MGLYIVSVASLALLATASLPEGLEPRILGRKDGVMAESQMMYRIEEHGTNEIIQMAVDAQGGADVKVNVLQPLASHTWHLRLSTEALAICTKAIQEVQMQYVPVRTPFYQIEADSERGMKKVAAWSKEDETPKFAGTRLRLDQSLHTAYFTALAYLSVGSEEEARHDLNKAGWAYKEGVGALGDAYRDSDVLDDTGMKLVLARSTEKRDGMAKAASIFQRVLESRVSSYARRKHLAAERVQ